MRVGKLSGAVGTFAATVPEVEEIACERLGLRPEPVSTQIVQRDRHADVLDALAVLASSLDKFATEIRHLARTEVREVEEPFGRGQKGSSAMPHKRNPDTSERICGLARVVCAASLAGIEDVALWHERDISHSSAERVAFPGAFIPLDYMLDRFSWLVEPGRAAGADASEPRVESRPVLQPARAPSPSSSRACLATTLTCASSRAQCEPRRRTSVRDVVAADPELAGRLDLDPVFDLAAYTRHVDVVFDRLQALVRRQGGGPCLRPPFTSPAERFAAPQLDPERLLLVASDRISTFDVVLPTEIPDKGRVLTGLAAFWFARTRDVCANHLLQVRSRRPLQRVSPAEMLPIECVVRGYLAGSGWKDYQRTGQTSGRALPTGLLESDHLPEPIFTPSTKAAEGHDETSTLKPPPLSSAKSASARSSERRSSSIDSPPTTRPSAGS